MRSVPQPVCDILQADRTWLVLVSGAKPVHIPWKQQFREYEFGNAEISTAEFQNELRNKVNMTILVHEKSHWSGRCEPETVAEYRKVEEVTLIRALFDRYYHLHGLTMTSHILLFRKIEGPSHGRDKWAEVFHMNNDQNPRRMQKHRPNNLEMNNTPVSWINEKANDIVSNGSEGLQVFIPL